jgi:NADP-dependent 3-hydroxy acid dehydrogenase YdfG
MNGMERFSGKTALVTGATSGIGRSTALRLCGEGMNVVASGRRRERLDELETAAAQLGPGHGELAGVVADLRDSAQIGELFAALRQRFGGTDVLVNNAGLGHDAPLLSGASDKWREMLDVNVLALCICTREALEDMRARGDDGHVVHISSMAGHRVPGGSGVYAATKFAVRALTEGLRKELRAADSRVRVSAISPGFVETEFAAHYHQSEKAARRTYGRYPVIQPDEVADAVAYAISRPPHMEIHDVLIRPTQQVN